MKPEEPTIKKFVIHPDRLPASFPHYAVIYWIIFNHCTDYVWWIVAITSLILTIIILLYLHRKGIEVPNRTR